MRAMQQMVMFERNEGAAEFGIRPELRSLRIGELGMVV